ncbi:polysaccharide deacetylase family protein [Schleiferilactobacillus harbinensis]|uniref:NodB homology domain-containing protein n=1 Tax=Schleiferilactobacillus harbinensis DSM 16991 TaxID=1122147 RepID=A0A0R1XJH5_9LACO|nr:polysaccharide deacetylase family protein [Schleiferilactobacillus harbinensis]KRM27542.1 hypothetical protein FC91_GL002458 [Schleiferilactobacillus harbinensis DSM 16991]QFR62700.1 polysaccharide deacetylase family protein [Schleiferilactobacillus harbinensis]
MEKKRHFCWFLGLLVILLFGVIGTARGQAQAAAPGATNSLTVHQVLTVYSGTGKSAQATGESVQPGQQVKIGDMTTVDGYSWLGLGDDRWISFDPSANPTYESRLWTRTPITIYRGLGGHRIKTADSIAAGTGKTVTAYIDLDGSPWYQVGKDEWASTSSRYNPVSAQQTLQLSFTTTVYTGTGMQRRATSRTLPALSSVTYTNTLTEGSTTWYNIGNDDWVTTDPAYNPGFEQYVYVPTSVPIWTTYTANRIKTAQIVSGNTNQVLQGTVSLNGVKWYKIGVNQWITLDSATSSAAGQKPTGPTAKRIVTLLGTTNIFTAPNGAAIHRILKNGTQWRYFTSQVINGSTWYNLGGKQWVTNAQDTTNWEKKADTIQFPILMYHELADNQPNNSWYVPVREFAQEMQWLRDNGYYFLNTQEAYTVLTTNQAPSDKLVWLTMDDGYESWFTKGLPIIQQNGVHGTMFLITNTGGLTRQQAVIMKENGMDIESHTVNHFDLSQLPDYQQKQEMLGAKQYLDSTYQQNTTAIAYPYGNYNDATKTEAAASGYTLGLRIHDGLASKDNGLYSLNRIKVSPGLTAAQFQYLVEHGKDQEVSGIVIGPPILK